MSAPKMTRHEMKQDDLATFLERATSYARKNPVPIRNAGLAAAGVIVLVALIYLFMSSRASATEAMLQEAQARFTGPVVATGAQPNSSFPTYSSETERDNAALESFTRLVQEHGSTRQGRLARYYQGVLLARLGRTEDARKALEEFVASPSNPLLGALARAQLAQALAQTGHPDDAIKIFSELAEEKDGAYPQDWALFFMAETQWQQGKKAEAAANYQKIVKDFPTSTFVATAKERAKGA